VPPGRSRDRRPDPRPRARAGLAARPPARGARVHADAGARALWSLGPLRAGGALLLVLAEGALPTGAIVAMGYAVGRIPAAARTGLHGSAATHLILALVLAVGVYALSLLTGPFQEMLSTSVKARLTEEMQQRLMRAVSAPVGIAHLEDAATLDRLELARGTLASWVPADAPITLAGVLGTRLSGVLACAVVGVFRWYLGLGLLVMWLAVRGPLRRIIVGQVVAYRMKAESMRRAFAFHQTAWRPENAKEMRVFGLGRWMVGHYRRHANETIETSWRALRKVNPTMAALGAVVFAVYAVCLIVIAHAALHRHVSLQTLGVTLPMLPATMSAGTITFQEIGLEWMLAGLPDIDHLEEDLGERREALPGTRSPDGMPREGVGFKAVRFAYPGAPTHVLRGLDLDIPAGRSTAIVGLNGAGKTTLVKLLTRLHDPTEARCSPTASRCASWTPRRGSARSRSSSRISTAIR
jgi:ATP-binding cassette subfamily B protein